MADLIRRRPEYEQGLARLDPFRMLEALTNWEPFRRFAPMLEQEAFVPDFDVKETKDSYVFKADLPGTKEEDLDIAMTGNRLTVSGKREAEEKHEDEQYYTYERTYGSFSRSFTLPEGTDPDRVNAELKDGVLTLVVPKTEKAQPKRISLGKKGSEKAKA